MNVRQYSALQDKNDKKVLRSEFPNLYSLSKNKYVLQTKDMKYSETWDFLNGLKKEMEEFSAYKLTVYVHFFEIKFFLLAFLKSKKLIKVNNKILSESSRCQLKSIDARIFVFSFVKCLYLIASNLHLVIS